MTTSNEDCFEDEYMSRIENNECVSGMSNAIELVERVL